MKPLEWLLILGMCVGWFLLIWLDPHPSPQCDMLQHEVWGLPCVVMGPPPRIP